ncbi:MAG: GNAT family N-acetyltransferase [Lacipirellulaceae bacterium]
MNVECLETLDALEPYWARWDELAGDCVFRSALWQRTWIEHYCFCAQSSEQQADSNLRVIVVRDDSDQIVAILPCYEKQSFALGRVWRLVGDGEVCSDHLGFLFEQERADQAVEAIAEYLARRDDWDCFDFTYFDANDDASCLLAEVLKTHNCFVESSPGPNCWSIDLPETWDGYLMMLSKSHRKHIRRLQRSAAAAGPIEWHLVEDEQDFEAAWANLVDLHQRRRHSLGEPGCFASTSWAEFHKDIAQKLLSAGILRLSSLELGGRFAAAEYQFATPTTISAYQGGLDPDRLDEQPGRLSLIHTIQHAISQGCTRYDLMRGDEPYKASWRAEPNRTLRVQVTPARLSARLRFTALQSVRKAGRFAKQMAGNTRKQTELINE